MSDRSSDVLLSAFGALLILSHLDLGLPEALQPLNSPELAELPFPLSLVRGIPSPDRLFFTRHTSEPAVLVLKAIGTGLLIGWLLCRHTLPAGRVARRAAWSFVVALVAALYLLPAAIAIYARLRTGDPSFAHDGGTLEIEVASRMLLSGRDPYRESFRGTEVESWRGLETNATEHLPYFPWAFVPLAPAVATLDALGLPDLRLVYALGAIVLAILLALPEPSDDRRQLLVLLPFFTPLLAKASILGTNDHFALLWIAGAVLLLERGRPRAAMVALGLAMGVKQFTWLLWPLMAAHASAQSRAGACPPPLRAAGLRLAAIPLLVLAFVAMPFFLWDPGSFLDDTFGFALGGSRTAHAIKGVGAYGLGSLALAYGLVHDAKAPFPESALGLLLSLGVLAILMRRQGRGGTVSSLLFGFALALLPFLYTARYFHGNFLGFCLFLLLWGASRTTAVAVTITGSGSVSEPGSAGAGSR